MDKFPLIIGHRGASAVAPENTMGAFRKAIEVGADGIEFDVRLSRDGVPIVIHDETLHRTGLRSDYVSCLSAEELQQVNVGKWFGHRRNSADDYVNETVPTLRKLLDYSSSVDAVLYLELKCRREETTQIASITCDLLVNYQLAERVIIECFDLPVIQEVKRIAPHLKTAALFQPRISRPHLWSSSKSIIEEARAVGADEIALHHKLADDRTIESAHSTGLKVVIWTVDDPAWIIRAKKLGVHALITNDPASMIRHDD
ncbi:MAG TPA: glycerophosphodiester phosphodiesterase family protein [Pyrinomonadaceae bacterium]